MGANVHLSLSNDQLDRLANLIAVRVARAESRVMPSLGFAATVSRAPSSRTLGTGTPVLWTARRVAAHYGVSTGFVYQHANELGCIRLGGGPCPRLRFDPDVVRERWPVVGEPQSAPPRSRSRSSVRRVNASPSSFDLLDFDREP